MALLGHLPSPWTNNSGQGNGPHSWPDLGPMLTPAARGWRGWQAHGPHVGQMRLQQAHGLHPRDLAAESVCAL